MVLISDFINNDFKAIESSEIIFFVQEFFATKNFSHFPIIENNIYIGCMGAEDIDNFDSEKKVLDYRYVIEGFFARTNMIWIDVMEIFVRNHTNIMPVLDENNLYVGYYEINDIISFFTETPFLKELGNVIILEKTVADYSMSQIAQIVEGNNGKLLGAFISDAKPNKIQITLKISLGAINEILQTFRRYDYEIVSNHQEDNYLTNLKERSDYLEKYLNI
jgi:predicted transcriptional regulator